MKIMCKMAVAAIALAGLTACESFQGSPSIVYLGNSASATVSTNPADGYGDAFGVSLFGAQTQEERLADLKGEPKNEPSVVTAAVTK